MENKITLVLTSCNRLDLLDRTLASIGDEVLDSIKHKIIIDDSGDPSVKDYFTKYKAQDGWKIILNDENIGQPKSVDKAYSFVDTEYVFHCEDDWIFNEKSYLRDSLSVLENDSTLLQVTFRADDPHPNFEEVLETQDGVRYQIKNPAWRGIWYGFTYNPSLFRKEAYDKIKPYAGKDEQTISKLYFDNGYRTAALVDKFVNHIGWGRSTGSHLKL